MLRLPEAKWFRGLGDLGFRVRLPCPTCLQSRRDVLCQRFMETSHTTLQEVGQSIHFLKPQGVKPGHREKHTNPDDPQYR